MTPHLGRDITKLRTAEQTPDISTFLWFFLPYFGSVTCFRLYTGRQFLQSVCLNISNPSPTLSTPRRKAQKRDWVICQPLQGHFPRPLTIKKKKERKGNLPEACSHCSKHAANWDSSSRASREINSKQEQQSCRNWLSPFKRISWAPLQNRTAARTN